MRSIDIRGDTPTMDFDDELKVDVIEHPFKFRHLAKDPDLANAIIDTINLMGSAGACAEDDYQTGLNVLRRKNKAACRAIAEEYASMKEDRHLDRWSLVMLLAELQDKGCVKIFAEVLGEAIPEERSKDPHTFSTVGEEIMIRTTAIEGLERMAADGNDAAMGVLWENAQHENFSIRRAAVQALVATGDKDVREQLKEKLPKRYQDVLAIDRRDVREVEQAQGGLFLKQRDDDGAPDPNDECKPKDDDPGLDRGQDKHDGCNCD